LSHKFIYLNEKISLLNQKLGLPKEETDARFHSENFSPKFGKSMHFQELPRNNEFDEES